MYSYTALDFSSLNQSHLIDNGQQMLPFLDSIGIWEALVLRLVARTSLNYITSERASLSVPVYLDAPVLIDLFLKHHGFAVRCPKSGKNCILCSWVFEIFQEIYAS